MNAFIQKQSRGKGRINMAPYADNNDQGGLLKSSFKGLWNYKGTRDCPAFLCFDWLAGNELKRAEFFHPENSVNVKCG